MSFLPSGNDPNSPVWVTVVLFESKRPACSVNPCVAGTFLLFILVWCWACLIHPIRGFLLWQQKYRAVHKRAKILCYLVWALVNILPSEHSNERSCFISRKGCGRRAAGQGMGRAPKPPHYLMGRSTVLCWVQPELSSPFCWLKRPWQLCWALQLLAGPTRQPGWLCPMWQLSQDSIFWYFLAMQYSHVSWCYCHAQSSGKITSITEIFCPCWELMSALS